MRTRITSMAVAAAAAAALSGLGSIAASAAGPASQTEARALALAVASGAAATPGAQLWVKRYNAWSRKPGASVDMGRSVAVSPDGAVVFVTGFRHAWPASDYGTIAYSAATGTRLWIERYNGPGNGDDEAASVAVSPTGGTVFVTGSSRGVSSNADYATVAYNAVTGAQEWVQRYNGPGNFADDASKVMVSPDGNTVFVTGQSYGGSSTNYDYATVAYNAATGAQEWVQRYNGPANFDDLGVSETVSPSGDAVFVTGDSNGTGSGNDYATVAYNAATGAQEWVQRYNGPANSGDLVQSVAVGPGGDTVFVTGGSASNASGSTEDYATVAYSAATGAQEWVQRYNGPGSSINSAASVAVSPSGGTVFVTGVSARASSGFDFATVAYNAAAGAQQWVKFYNGPANGEDNADAVTVSPTGVSVYVTGYSFGAGTGPDYATVAYGAATGARQWVRRYNGTGNGQDEIFAAAVSPSGDRVFVTGQSTGTASNFDYITIAYSG